MHVHAQSILQRDDDHPADGWHPPIVADAIHPPCGDSKGLRSKIGRRDGTSFSSSVTPFRRAMICCVKRAHQPVLLRTPVETLYISDMAY